MSKLYLYTIFHANLQFSCIPEDQYSAIIDRCYWPVLSLLDEFPVSLGFEFPAFTLEKINQIDSTFIKALKNHSQRDRCEIIGSGYSQNIMPLIPARLNALNLSFGNSVYRQLLGSSPKIAYVDEQVYSGGLPKLYKDAGYEGIILDWDNSVEFGNFPPSYRYQTVWLKGIDGTRIKLVWNHSIAFQKFQRYIHGEITLEEYIEYITAHISKDESRAFLLYGSDWEIFNYRPGNADIIYFKNKNLKEVERLEKLFDSLSSLQSIEVISPSKVLQSLPPKNEVEIGTSEYPIPTKKQAKYNVIRWAVCGREDAKINTQCHQVFETLSSIDTLSHSIDASIMPFDEEQLNSQWLQLCYLWGSDFRTNTTEEKFLEFRNKMGSLLEDSRRNLHQLTSKIRIKNDFALFNTLPIAWSDTAFEFRLYFDPGKYFDDLAIALDDEKVVTQVENKEYYKDGSIRSAKFLVTPSIPPQSLIQGRIISEKSKKRDKSLAFEATEGKVKTNQVEVEFSSRRGGAIKKLAFPGIFNRHLAGTIPHDYYDQIEFSTDQYTAHTILQEKIGKKITDLDPTELLIPNPDEYLPIRVPVVCKIPLPIGQLWKTYLIYIHEPRVDVKFHFRIQDLSPYFFRLGMLTINPEAFDRNTLQYATVNGGEVVEKFYLKGKSINQLQTIDARISSSHCLGATEGWVDISDGSKGIAVITNKSQQYSAPLLHYEETRSSFYLRVYNSLCETDESTNQLWRGHNVFCETFLGHRADISTVRLKSQQINRGLILIPKC